MQALHVDLLPILATGGPDKIASGAEAVGVFQFFVHDLLFEVIGVVKLAERKCRGSDAPGDIACVDRFPFDRIVGFLHPLGESASEDHAILDRAIVVLAGGDVAACSVEVDMLGARQISFAKIASETGEVAAHAPFAVIALRMGRVVRNDAERSFAVIEHQHLHVRIDDAFGFGADFRVLCRTVANVLDLPIRPHDAASGRDLVDLGLADADVGDALRFHHGLFDGLGDAIDRLASENGIEELAAKLVRCEQVVGLEVAAGGVVLVQTMDGDAFLRRAGRLRDGLAELRVSAVADADPINCAHHDRLFVGEKNDAASRQRIDDFLSGDDQAVAQRRADRWRHVGLERRDLERHLTREEGQGNREQEKRQHYATNHVILHGLRRCD